MGFSPLRGALAGAAGTCALNFAAYLDMAATRRPASEVPRLAAHAIAAKLGLEPKPIDDEPSLSRWEGFGEALGHVHGVSQGIGYAVLRGTVLDGPPWWVGAMSLCLETFVVGEGTCVALGATDPTTWGVAGYARGLGLRLAFGVVTALAYEALAPLEEATYSMSELDEAVVLDETIVIAESRIAFTGE